MNIDISTIQKVTKLTDITNIFSYGSNVYGTATIGSDHDFIVVANDAIDHQQIDSYDGKISTHTYSPNTFQELIHQHKIFALECLFLNESEILLNTRKYKFTLDKQLLRNEISQKASNSWVKAKKKIEVEHDEYLGIKSLFHSFRIILFGIDIAKNGRITNYSSANGIFSEICKRRLVNEDENKLWKELEFIFKSQHNALMSEFRILCPK